MENLKVLNFAVINGSRSCTFVNSHSEAWCSWESVVIIHILADYAFSMHLDGNPKMLRRSTHMLYMIQTPFLNDLENLRKRFFSGEVRVAPSRNIIITVD